MTSLYTVKTVVFCRHCRSSSLLLSATTADSAVTRRGSLTQQRCGWRKVWISEKRRTPFLQRTRQLLFCYCSTQGRHGNPRGTKIMKLGGDKIYVFVSKENKRIKPIKRSNKCVDVYV